MRLRHCARNPVLACLSTSVVLENGGIQDTTVRGSAIVASPCKPPPDPQRPTGHFLGTGPNVYPQLESEEGTTIARMPPPLDYIDELGVFHYPYLTNTWPG